MNTFDNLKYKTAWTWDYQFQFANFERRGLNILPSRTLVVNLGFREDAAHTSGEGTGPYYKSSEALDWPLLHPEKVERNEIIDRTSSAWHLDCEIPVKLNFTQKLKRSIKKRLNRLGLLSNHVVD